VKGDFSRIEDTFSSMKWAKNKILHIICRGFQ
jgi:hypothetical protein